MLPPVQNCQPLQGKKINSHLFILPSVLNYFLLPEIPGLKTHQQLITKINPT